MTAARTPLSVTTCKSSDTAQGAICVVFSLAVKKRASWRPLECISRRGLGRVALGGYSPRAPTVPYVRNSRIRFFKS